MLYLYTQWCGNTFSNINNTIQETILLLLVITKNNFSQKLEIQQVDRIKLRRNSVSIGWNSLLYYKTPYIT